MRLDRKSSFLDQTIAFVREGVATGRWKKGVPGVRPLAAELGISPSTVQKAIRRLEKEGIIVPQGAGRSRRAGATPAEPLKQGARRKSGALRVGILTSGDITSMLVDPYVTMLESWLEKRGYESFRASKSARNLREDPERILTMLSENPADAWIGFGCSQGTLETISTHFDTPFLAWGGRYEEEMNLAHVTVRIAPAVRACTRRLIELGHRRIVMVCSDFWRKPKPGYSVRAFCEELTAAKVAVSDYHLPDWTPTKEGFGALLDSLFSLTPPTAMIVEDAAEALAVAMFLASRGRGIPRHLSLVVMMENPALKLATPSLAHFQTPIDRSQRHILRWLEGCATGTQEKRSVEFDATFVDGESIAPPGV